MELNTFTTRDAAHKFVASLADESVASKVLAALPANEGEERIVIRHQDLGGAIAMEVTLERKEEPAEAPSAGAKAIADVVTRLRERAVAARDAHAPKPDRVPSTSDKRTLNNAMRHTYRTLTDDEKRHVEMFKDMGEAFLDLLHVVGKTGPYSARLNANPDHLASRELSLARTHIEDAVMRAVRHITK